MRSLSRASLLSLGSSLLLAACGGNVVVDSGSTGTGGGGGGAEPGSCDALLADFQAKQAAAVECNPFINAIQCDGSAFVYDACGCQVLANETNPATVAAAQTSYEAAFAAICFAPCDGPCQVYGGGFCSSNGGSTGVCMVALPD